MRALVVCVFFVGGALGIHNLMACFLHLCYSRLKAKITREVKQAVADEEERERARLVSSNAFIAIMYPLLSLLSDFFI